MSDHSSSKIKCKVVPSGVCSAAAAGEIIISGDVADVVRDEVVLMELPPAVLKGKSEPVPVWKVLSEKT